MDIEKLKELKSVVEAKSCRTEIDDGEEYVYEIDDKELMWALEECSALIDEVIARQSVKSEDVAEAIEYYKSHLAERLRDGKDEVTKRFEIVITALHAYKPTTRKDRIVEEVQEAIEWATEELNDSIRYQNNYKAGCLDTIITALQAYHPWVSVDDRLPEKPQYDWVLVHITLSPDGFVGLPHVAELRRGKWFSTEYDLPIEQILQGTVTHWIPLPKPPESEG